MLSIIQKLFLWKIPYIYPLLYLLYYLLLLQLLLQHQLLQHRLLLHIILLLRFHKFLLQDQLLLLKLLLDHSQLLWSYGLLLLLNWRLRNRRHGHVLLLGLSQNWRLGMLHSWRLLLWKAHHSGRSDLRHWLGIGYHLLWSMRLWSLATACYSVVVIVNISLHHKVISVYLLELLRCLRIDLSYAVQHILSHILVSILLKYIPWQWLFFILRSMNKMTKVASLTSHRSMKILTRHSPKVTHFYRYGGFDLLLSLHLFLSFTVDLLQMPYLSLNGLNTLLMLEPHLNDRKVRQLFLTHLARASNCVLCNKSLQQQLYLFLLIYITKNDVRFCLNFI